MTLFELLLSMLMRSETLPRMEGMGQHAREMRILEKVDGSGNLQSLMEGSPP